MKPYYETETGKLYCGSNLEVLPELPDNSVDSIVTDPPYELGFMGKKWDASGIAYNIQLWKECLRVLKPGGHLLAFGGTRTYHRMAVAIEDAGFEVRDMIEWVYGSGFPKSLNIGKAVDKLQGNERETYLAPIAYPDSDCWGIPNNNISGNNWGVVGADDSGKGKGQGKAGMTPRTKGTSEWEGWGTALKPAHEPICMARKPLAEKTVAENVLKYRTGGINIDESRVGIEDEDLARENKKDNGMFGVGNNNNAQIRKEKGLPPVGRFPANLIHDNSEEVRECFPETKSGKAIRSNSGGKTFGGENTKPVMEDLGYEDGCGNASRFFKSIIYQAKASRSERNKGLENLPDKPAGFAMRDDKFTIENMGNTPASKREPVKNNHPTVKPIALMEYLIIMVTRKGGTVLDPFMGSGSTGVACKDNGFNFIGIELAGEYCQIAKARIENEREQLRLDL